MTVSLLIVHPFDPWGSKIGGIETAVRSTIQYAPNNFQLSLIGVTQNTVQRPLNSWQELEYKSKRVSFLPILKIENPNQRGRIPLFLSFSTKLFRYHLSFHSSLALFHRVEPLFCSRIDAGANILCIHGDSREIIGPYSEVRWKHIPWIYKRIESNAVQKARRIFVVSRKGTEYLQKRYMRHEDISFLPTGYSEELFSLPEEEKRESLYQRVIQQYDLKPFSKFVLFTGRFEKQKDPVLALKSFSKLSERLPDVSLLLVGDGSLKADMKRVISFYQLENRVFFLGSLSAEELAEVMKISHAFLMTSRFEGMPIVVLEAQACGLPVVSTDAGEIRRMILEGQTGVVVSESNPEMVATGLEDVLFHPDQYKKENCAQAVQPFRMRIVLDNFFNELRQIAVSL